MDMPLERTNYFFGQLLGVADFEREQQYLLNRLRRHNRFAHGWGVLEGLQVLIDPSDVVVKPGIAIDCEGNEIQIHDEQRVPLPSSTAPFYIGVRFTETLSAPNPAMGGANCGVVVESAEIDISTVNAAVGHSRQGPGTPGCGNRHTLVLARAHHHNGSWQLRRSKSSA
jgi:hypothetical protein